MNSEAFEDILKTMASLTDTSILARKLIRYSIYAVILLIVGRYALRGGAALYRRIFPKPPPPPTVSFGKLPGLPFPERKDVPTFLYVLETPDGKLPAVPDQGVVYFMPPLTTQIRSLEIAQDKARALGFNPNAKPILENIPSIYLFQKAGGAPSTLIMNIVTGTFSINYDTTANPGILNGTPPNEDNALARVQGVLSNAGLLTQDLSTGRNIFEFSKVEGGKFVPAVSLSEANITKVNIFRKSFGETKIPSVSSNGTEANVWFLLATGGEIIAAEYHYFPIDESKFSTYPLKTAEKAWDDLKAGKAFIANAGENQEGKMAIRRVYLGYYDAGQYTEFYQPVIIFEGDNNFLAYVPAVTEEYYGK